MNTFSNYVINVSANIFSFLRNQKIQHLNLLFLVVAASTLQKGSFVQEKIIQNLEIKQRDICVTFNII